MKSFSSKIINNLKTCGCLGCALASTIPFIFLSLIVFLLFLGQATRFPPQIFGTYSDHFRTYVISPIPYSVKIFDIEIDDILIHPDVGYYFRFYINEDDLRKIISYRSLELTTRDCYVPSHPKWWNIKSSDHLAVYKFNNKDWLEITLCYDTDANLAYYLYYTY